MNKQQLDYFRPYINPQDRANHGARYKPIKTNEHHPACRSRVENGSENYRIQLYETLHTPFHQVFGNGLFQENLEQLQMIQGGVLSEKFKKDLQELINMKDDYVYRDGIWIKR